MALLLCVCGGIVGSLSLGWVIFRKISASFFRATAVLLMSGITGSIFCYRALVSFMEASRISSLGVFWGVLLLWGKK